MARCQIVKQQKEKGRCTMIHITLTGLKESGTLEGFLDNLQAYMGKMLGVEPGKICITANRKTWDKETPLCVIDLLPESLGPKYSKEIFPGENRYMTHGIFESTSLQQDVTNEISVFLEKIFKVAFSVQVRSPNLMYCTFSR